MRIFLIGDVQACYRELVDLLDAMAPASDDQIWFCGDLVGRGPDALATMQFISSLPNARSVLGNHDLHLLAIASKNRKPKPSLRLEKLLTDSRLEEYLAWLRRQSFALAHKNILLVHASVHPSWTEEDALTHSSELEQVLAQDDYGKFLRDMYTNEPTVWQKSLSEFDRRNLLLNIFTRVRYHHPDGHILFDRDDCPSASDSPEGDRPWFEIPHQRQPSTTVFFGHWSALADYTISPAHQAFHLDKGCVWGNRLYGVRLEWPKYDQQSTGYPLDYAKDMTIKSYHIPSTLSAD